MAERIGQDLPELNRSLGPTDPITMRVWISVVRAWIDRSGHARVTTHGVRLALISEPYRP